MGTARLIAFYLPRFHPLPEDEGWRGKGFTDWLEAARARPLFEGHYQPHLPADLGFYDQRLPQTLRDQVQTAKDHGIDGFCHLYYWFSGQRLLGAPLDAMLADPESKMPFCLCWANESWTRRGPDGRLETLIAQGYGPQDDLDFIRGVAPYLKDPRYIRAGGAPLLLVRRPQQLPDARKSAGIWRELCREAGVGDIHLCAALTHGNEDYARLGFDSGVELPPHNLRVASAAHRIRFTQPFRGSVALYEDMARFSLERARPGRNVFLTVVPSWDNTARAGSGALVVLNGTPANYEFWLAQALRKAEQCFPGQERPVFINAWNDWAQGCHIEPDQKHGRAFLEATLRAKRGDCRLAGFPDVGVPGDGPAQGKPYVAKAAASHAATPPAPAAKAAMTPSHPTGFLRRLGLKADRQAESPPAADQIWESTFCFYPFTQLNLLPSGAVQPCCMYQGHIEANGRPMRFPEDSIDAIWNSKYLRDMRRAIAEGRPVAECEYCYRCERNGMESLRALAARQCAARGTTLREVLSAALSNDYRVLSRPQQLELRVGSLCNLRCRMCGGHSSSAIKKDPVHGQWAPELIQTAAGPEWVRRPEHLYGDLLQDPRHLRHLVIVGGEPLLVPETRDILRGIIRTGAAKNITLCLFTNGTVCDDEFLGMARWFKFLSIAVSIDGHGALNDYIRYPSRWQIVAANLQRLRRTPNAQVVAHVTVQAYNMLNLVELAQYCDEMGLDLHTCVLQFPAHLSSLAMPPAVRMEAARRLHAYFSGAGREGPGPLRRPASPRNALQRMAARLLGVRRQAPDQLLQLASAWESGGEADPALLREFMVFTNDLDASRGQDSARTLPELRGLLETSGIKWVDELRHADRRVRRPSAAACDHPKDE